VVKVEFFNYQDFLFGDLTLDVIFAVPKSVFGLKREKQAILNPKTTTIKLKILNGKSQVSN